jgi:enoyl-CoA hydratase/carnithine racemase
MPDTLAPASRLLHTQLDDGVLTISLHAPERGNALTWHMVTSLDELWQRIALREDVRVVVLRGSGDVFSMGLDVDDFSQVMHVDVPRARAALECLHQWRSRLLKILPQPVIGQVAGACHGAAVRLVEGCDIVLAAEDAAFMLSGPDASLIARHPACVPGPDWIDACTLSQLQSQGRTVSGLEAAQHGLVTFACTRETLEHEVMELARALSDKDRLALQFTKETVAHVGSMSWDAAVNFTAAKFAELKSRQASGPSARASGVHNFLAGKSKPGLGG